MWKTGQNGRDGVGQLSQCGLDLRRATRPLALPRNVQTVRKVLQEVKTKKDVKNEE
jgi:hypothetical protein